MCRGFYLEVGQGGSRSELSEGSEPRLPTSGTSSDSGSFGFASPPFVRFLDDAQLAPAPSTETPQYSFPSAITGYGTSILVESDLRILWFRRCEIFLKICCAGGMKPLSGHMSWDVMCRHTHRECTLAEYLRDPETARLPLLTRQNMVSGLLSVRPLSTLSRVLS
jgi:hypothetical protein